ncbi:MAG: Holliday junction branch migration DNA helicase RuvB, partial [Cellvibrionales bacterium]|nr:Holliday junction branch migration DNA helicase RuvB [Cellvibrionales bacterium]
MIEPDRLISGQPGLDDVDHSTRPQTLDDYHGQPKVKEQMAIFLQAAKLRNDALDHTLIFGPPGL